MQRSDLMNGQKKAVTWNEWGGGTPMIEISRKIEKPPVTIFSYLQYHGGMRPY